jgi:HTH-type transcriptional regulator/antitoxin HigA
MATKDSKVHPGFFLSELIETNGISQKDLASELEIAPSLLNGILKGKRNITPTLAISLEAMGIGSASELLKLQIEYSLEVAKKDTGISSKLQKLNEWKKISDIVPISFFKQDPALDIVNSDSINKIYKIYNVDNYEGLKKYVNNYPLLHFRKSFKLESDKKNLVAWSVLAKYKAGKQKVKNFDTNSLEEVVKELKPVFYTNKKTVSKTKKILNKHGIKFLILDRPTKTNADGKSFMCGENPVIVLSLKYKRLDNFAFTLLHEILHVYNHINSKKYASSKISDKENDLLELEADRFSRNTLIPVDLWQNFIYNNDKFSDDVIISFATKHKIHPGIVRGRICHENPEYYRKRTAITKYNILDIL